MQIKIVFSGLYPSQGDRQGGQRSTQCQVLWVSSLPWADATISTCSSGKPRTPISGPVSHRAPHILNISQCSLVSLSGWPISDSSQGWRLTAGGVRSGMPPTLFALCAVLLFIVYHCYSTLVFNRQSSFSKDPSRKQIKFPQHLNQLCVHLLQLYFLDHEQG